VLGARRAHGVCVEGVICAAPAHQYKSEYTMQCLDAAMRSGNSLRRVD
jgi:hypothetical protein